MEGPVKSKTLILADTDGAPEGLLEDPDGRLRSDLGSYRLLSSMADLLVLQRHAEDDGDQPRERVLMAGEILTSSTVLEVMNMIVASRWAGTLHVHGLDSHRTLGFDKAALRHARSDHPEDRLDKILFRIGVLTPAQAESVMRELKPEQRFGEVLVERGLIQRGKLFEYLQKQMEEIFFSAVLEREGAYVFCVAEGTPAPSVIAHLPAQQLLFAAAERLDQFKDCQQLIPDLRSRPELAPEVDLTRLRSKDRLVLSYCDGERTLREIASETWLGRYETLRIVHGYIMKGHLRLLQPSRTTEELAEGLAEPFERALREIFDAVKRNGTLTHLRRDLKGRIDESEHSQHLRRIVSPKGRVDPEGIASWLASLEIRDRTELVGHTLHELASFALFNASLTLPRAEERELAEKVNLHLQQISEH